jgi:hypothetical protein
MTRLDIGWATPAQKQKFALSTYSKKIDRLDGICPGGFGMMKTKKMKMLMNKGSQGRISGKVPEVRNEVRGGRLFAGIARNRAASRLVACSHCTNKFTMNGVNDYGENGIRPGDWGVAGSGGKHAFKARKVTLDSLGNIQQDKLMRQSSIIE